jgi:hypothetical protein
VHFILLVALTAGIVGTGSDAFLPVGVPDRHSATLLTLTEIGGFGVRRKARPKVPSHLHTGIDIRRPHRNYENESVYPIAGGTVISKRTDGPYAHLIIEHEIGEKKFWSVYEHIAGISVSVASRVNPLVPVARFLNREELGKYGWQFDHMHLEILREKPMPLKPALKTPERFYRSYSLECMSPAMLNRYFYDPLEFF